MEFGELLWGVLSTFAAFLVGLAWKQFSAMVTHVRARRFWRPIVAHDAIIIVGSFRDIPEFEASGVIGVGDTLALNDLQNYFASIGYKRFEVKYSSHMVLGNDPSDSPLQRNLVLLGGPDGNVVTRMVLQRIALGIEFCELPPDRLYAADAGTRTPPKGVRRIPGFRSRGPSWRIPVVLDRTTGQMHGPAMDGTVLTHDCGVLVRCRNPFNDRRHVILFCGSYGHGTLAAVRYAQTKEFLDNVPSDADAIECVLSVDVLAETVQDMRVQFVRAVDQPELPPGVAVTVPRIVG